MPGSLPLCLLAAAALLLPSTTAFYYKEVHPHCPVHQHVKLFNETVHVGEVVVVVEPIVVPVYHLSTVYQTTVLPVTSHLFHTVTAEAVGVQFTETLVVTTAVHIPLTRVRTLTTTVTDTVVQVFTDLATNYHSAFDTVARQETQLVEATEVETVVADVTQTVVETLHSTIVVTEVEERTSLMAEALKEVVTSTALLPHHHTSTHTLTKRITQTFCPLPLEDI
ncbi:uncharacterized protein [Panulirus ornatus]|uniref:uncharacterized protein n=1 Tax=Panulirus ornatus TaxID=150431 RepID=UPI003A8770DF